MLVFKQRSKADPSSPASRKIAQRGVSGASSRSPWSSELQRSFGPQARAVEFHGEQQANQACEELGVRAYALETREDGTPQSERRARAAEQKVAHGQHVEIPAKREAGGRAPLSFYSEYHWGLDTFDNKHQWHYTLDGAHAMRMSDGGDIAVEQMSSGGSADAQKYLYATDALAYNTNGMFISIGSPFRLIPDGQGNVPDPNNLDNVQRALPRWTLEREDNEDRSCGGRGIDMKTHSDCRDHAWDVLNIGTERGIVVHAPKLDAHGLRPTPEIHPALQLAYLMMAVGEYLEAEREKSSNKLSPERLEQRKTLEKVYKAYQRQAMRYVQEYFAIRCIQNLQAYDEVPKGPLAAKCRLVEPQIYSRLENEKVSGADLKTRIDGRSKAVDYAAFLAGEMARKPYDALAASEKRALAKEIGFNEWAAPEMGDALAIVQGGMKGVNEGTNLWDARPARGLGPNPGDPSRFHYAAVIMKSGTDYVTFENIAGSPATGWFLQLYGHANKPGETSFHETYESSHGNRPTTMVLRPLKVL